ncbi:MULTISPECIES: hypothetical protein [unclassified Arthrobacter]|uniref:hypothetical protein n=1 Tax=unclassified Arthrobacter TaxID=235627 RepID=UPI001F3E4D48|nr:hypothetical protein [Arthrobacter sp. FW305-BF8]UKA53939.1 hypothetical protein LFT45_19880 [Arthrobacter sp. FW305-BF8]
MAKAVSFSVTAMPKSGAQGSFRDTVMSLRISDLQDCILSVFHISDSYALFSGEALPAPHTTSNGALRAYLLHRLAGGDAGLDFEVKIARVSEPARSGS